MEIRWSHEFRRQVKKLKKQHRSILDDIEDFQTLLQSGTRPGNRLTGLGGRPVYRARLRNTSANAGQSSGFRVVYFCGADITLFIMVDLRKNQSYVPPARIEAILKANDID